MAEYQDRERDHEFDGIVEYDNRVPGWLATLFNLSVVFAVVYLAWFMLGFGKLGAAAYEEERIEILRERMANMTELPGEEELRQLSHDPASYQRGEELFFGQGTCTQCHGPQGLGINGPNLRDDLWLHGSDMLEIIATLEDGVPDKGMPPVAQQGLGRQDAIALAAWIAHWNRTQKANGQGKTFPERAERDPIEY